jgi:hypothetical protein
VWKEDGLLFFNLNLTRDGDFEALTRVGGSYDQRLVSFGSVPHPSPGSGDLNVTLLLSLTGSRFSIGRLRGVAK